MSDAPKLQPRAETQTVVYDDGGLPVADFFEKETGNLKENWVCKSKVVAFDKMIEYGEGSSRVIKFKVKVGCFRDSGMEGSFKIELHERKDKHDSECDEFVKTKHNFTFKYPDCGDEDTFKYPGCGDEDITAELNTLTKEDFGLYKIELKQYERTYLSLYSDWKKVGTRSYKFYVGRQETKDAERSFALQRDSQLAGWDKLPKADFTGGSTEFEDLNTKLDKTKEEIIKNIEFTLKAVPTTMMDSGDRASMVEQVAEKVTYKMTLEKRKSNNPEDKTFTPTKAKKDVNPKELHEEQMPRNSTKTCRPVTFTNSDGWSSGKYRLKLEAVGGETAPYTLEFYVRKKDTQDMEKEFVKEQVAREEAFNKLPVANFFPNPFPEEEKGIGYMEWKDEEGEVCDFKEDGPIEFRQQEDMPLGVFENYVALYVQLFKWKREEKEDGTVSDEPKEVQGSYAMIKDPSQAKKALTLGKLKAGKYCIQLKAGMCSAYSYDHDEKYGWKKLRLVFYVNKSMFDQESERLYEEQKKRDHEQEILKNWRIIDKSGGQFDKKYNIAQAESPVSISLATWVHEGKPELSKTLPQRNLCLESGLYFLKAGLKGSSDNLQCRLTIKKKGALMASRGDVEKDPDSRTYVHQFTDHFTDCIKPYEFTQSDEQKEAEKAMAELIGMTKAKEFLTNIRNDYAMMKKMGRSKMKNTSKYMSLALSGNPGTGKTTFAQKLAQYLHAYGILKKSECKSLNIVELKAQYRGQTNAEVKKAFQTAEGGPFQGVLLLDEAHNLCPKEEKDTDVVDAISTLLTCMVDNKNDTCVIFCGYPDEMKTFLKNADPGLRRRVKLKIEIEDYGPEEIADIAVLDAQKATYKLGKGCRKVIQELVATVPAVQKKILKNYNASFFNEVLLAPAIDAYNKRWLSMDGPVPKKLRNLLLPRDIYAAVAQIPDSCSDVQYSPSDLQHFKNYAEKEVEILAMTDYIDKKYKKPNETETLLNGISPGTGSDQLSFFFAVPTSSFPDRHVDDVDLLLEYHGTSGLGNGWLQSQNLVPTLELYKIPDDMLKTIEFGSSPNWAAISVPGYLEPFDASFEDILNWGYQKKEGDIKKIDEKVLHWLKELTNTAQKDLETKKYERNMGTTDGPNPKPKPKPVGGTGTESRKKEKVAVAVMDQQDALASAVKSKDEEISKIRKEHLLQVGVLEKEIQELQDAGKSASWDQEKALIEQKKELKNKHAEVLSTMQEQLVEMQKQLRTHEQEAQQILEGKLETQRLQLKQENDLLLQQAQFELEKKQFEVEKKHAEVLDATKRQFGKEIQELNQKLQKSQAAGKSASLDQEKALIEQKKELENKHAEVLSTMQEQLVEMQKQLRTHEQEAQQILEGKLETQRLQLKQENDLLLQQKEEECQQLVAAEQVFANEMANILLSLVAQPAMAIAICFCIFSAPLILSMETLVFACASIAIGLAAYIYMYGWQALLALLWRFLKWLGVQGGLRLILIGMLYCYCKWNNHVGTFRLSVDIIMIAWLIWAAGGVFVEMCLKRVSDYFSGAGAKLLAGSEDKKTL